MNLTARQLTADRGSARPSRDLLGAAAWPRVWRALAWPALGLAVFALFTYTSLHGVIQSSDSVTPILEARAVLDGNLALAHWSLSLDSFWTVEVPFYVLGVAVFGVSPVLLSVVPALVATLVVLLGVALALEGHRGLAAWAGGLVVVAVLGLPGPFLTNFLLRGGTHIGTTLWCLVAFTALRRGRFGWAWAAGLVILAVATLGDLQTLFLGAVPVTLGGFAAIARRREWRAGLPAISAGALSAVLALLLRTVLVALGTFTTGPANHGLATQSQAVANLLNGLLWAGRLLGLVSTAAPVWLQGVHVLAALVLAGALIVTLTEFFRGLVGGRRLSLATERWRLDDLLLLAVACDACVFVALTVESDNGYARYLVPGLIFAVILTGRVVAQLVNVRQRSPHRVPVSARGVVGGCLMVALLFAAGMSFNLRGPLPSSPTASLRQFLSAHGLHRGIGDYWDASTVTVDSKNEIRVRPVIALDGKIVRYQRMSAGRWYRYRNFQFLVFNAVAPWGGVDAASATETFGAPRRTYRVGQLEVLVWSHAIHVTARGGGT